MRFARPPGSFFQPLAECMLHFLLASSIIPSSPFPAGMLQDLLLLLFPWIGHHGSRSLGRFSLLASELLSHLLGWLADGPVELTEDVGLDGCHTG